MERRKLVLPLALLLSGCGYIGNPLPPALNIPQPIADLRGVQRGGQIIAAFTPKLEATDGLLLPSLSAIELRAGPNPEKPFEVNHWAAQASRIPVAEAKAGPREVSFPIAEWAGKTVVVAVRSIGPRGRPSAWSNLLVLDIVSPPEPVAALKAEAMAKGVYLTWARGVASTAPCRVWRLLSGEQEATLLGVSPDASWLDMTAEYGKAYAYTVQRIVKSGEREAESEMSPEVRIQFEDIFPPAVPSGLTAMAGVKTVELNWDRNRELDFKAYQLYRAAADSEFVKVGAPLANPSYSDAAVESGKRYRYTVSSSDEKGNESARSAVVELVVP